MPEVRVIQPTTQLAKKQRVCAYARVSSDSSDQLHSFAVQMEYYTNHIRQNEEWDFVDIYADEAQSGTRADNREEFQRLMRDCRAGKIDRILVKSISRFARNITDCISAVRELKQLGVAVEFEKENLDTSTMGSEMILSMLSAAAQEESLSISKNLKWSYRRRMSLGEFTTYCAPLGYFYRNNTLVIDEKEAPIVQYIFTGFLAGMSTSEIAASLNRMESTIEKNGRWHSSPIRYILSNEKYVGDSLVQKKFTPEMLPFKREFNNGELSKYYIRNSHPMIIPRDIFDAAQKLLQQKTKTHASGTGIQQYPLSHIMKCGLCGSTFHRHSSNGKNRWYCHKHRQSKDSCAMGIVYELDVYKTFLTVFNKLLENKDFILRPMLSQLKELQSKSYFAKPEIVEINRKMSELSKQNHSLTRLQTKGCIDSAVFYERYNRNDKRIQELQLLLRQYREPDATWDLINSTKELLDVLNDSSPLLEFEPLPFKNMIKQISVYPQKFCFHLINGLILEEGRCTK